MKRKEEVRWIIILAVLFLISYFFTWKNWKEYKEKGQKIEIEILQYQLKRKRKKELEEQKRMLEKKRLKKQSEKTKESTILPFQHILEFEKLFVELLLKNSIELISISRVIFDGNFVKIPVEFRGKWGDLFSFLLEIENSPKTVILSEQYLKMEAINSELAKVHCTFVIQIEEENIQNFTFLTGEDFSLKKPYIKLGDRHVYF